MRLKNDEENEIPDDVPPRTTDGWETLNDPIYDIINHKRDKT